MLTNSIVALCSLSSLSRFFCFAASVLVGSRFSLIVLLFSYEDDVCAMSVFLRVPLLLRTPPEKRFDHVLSVLVGSRFSLTVLWFSHGVNFSRCSFVLLVRVFAPRPPTKRLDHVVRVLAGSRFS